MTSPRINTRQNTITTIGGFDFALPCAALSDAEARLFAGNLFTRRAGDRGLIVEKAREASATEKRGKLQGADGNA